VFEAFVENDGDHDEDRLVEEHENHRIEEIDDSELIEMLFPMKKK
jgi:hypothetical protein